ncbi:MAG: hypothetical protein COA54_02130 [Thiotrichaceae bacterium]|nr:MAG: hypothetical protein COA54_02130 [Thiotrichaceae bacterium]
MIRNGISSGSFEELVRKAYVDEAFSMVNDNQKKITISSVSAQTGLSRKEVKRLTELDDTHHSDIEQKYNRAIRVISGWMNDKRFTDASGKVKILPMDGDDISFHNLVKEFSGDIPTKAMLNLLHDAECVAIKDNQVELIKHAYVPGKDSEEVIRILGTDTNELINTIDFNLTAAENNKRYQRKVSTAVLDKDAIEDFKILVQKNSQALLEELDAWLTQNEVDAEDENARYISLGIYYYENKDQE